VSQNIFSPAGAPLKAVEQSTYCPTNRPAADFHEMGGGYAVRLDKACGTAGRWNFIYELTDDITACCCSLRHNGGEVVVKKALIPCWMSWLDADGVNIETCYLEAQGTDSFSRAVRRPAGAVRLQFSFKYRPDGQWIGSPFG
jgi:predicted enzyme related to lactoylglutathione lyase